MVSASPAEAATSGANGTHDPSRMIESGGKFYVYSTGGGSKSSTDGLAWTEGPNLFPNGIPASLTSVVSNNEGVWAPDAIYLNSQYYIYYALANSGNACAVGLVTTPTLDPSSPSYKLTDRGVVVSNTGSATYCAINPCPALDASGNLWLTFGSGYTKSSTDNTIYVMRLDNATGLPAGGGAAPGTPLEPGHIEASYVYYRAGYYYLFWNSGGCCSGAQSTYEILVARAQAITGPYTGSKIFLESAGSVHGPGQIGIYDQCGADRFTYHYYPDTGGSVLGENELSWGSDGWPVVGAESTTPLTACSPANGGGVPDASTVDAQSAGAEDAQGPRVDGGAGDDATTGESSASTRSASGGTGSASTQSASTGSGASETSTTGSTSSARGGTPDNGDDGGDGAGTGGDRPAGGCNVLGRGEMRAMASLDSACSRASPSARPGESAGTGPRARRRRLHFLRARRERLGAVLDAAFRRRLRRELVAATTATRGSRHESGDRTGRRTAAFVRPSPAPRQAYTSWCIWCITGEPCGIGGITTWRRECRGRVSRRRRSSSRPGRRWTGRSSSCSCS